MENVSLITGRTVRKIASVISTSSPLTGPGSSLQMRQPLGLASTFKIVPYSTFTLYPLPLSNSYRHWIVLTGSVLNQRWYIVSFWASGVEDIALIGASKRSWIKALTCFMRFKRESFPSLSSLFEADPRKTPLAITPREPTKEELETKFKSREERAKAWDAIGAIPKD